MMDNVKRYDENDDPWGVRGSLSKRWTATWNP